MSAGRIVAAVTGVLGLIGLGLTLLPVLTVQFDERAVYYAGPLTWLYGVGDLDSFCEVFPEECQSDGTIAVSLGFLDLLGLSGVPAVGLVPITMGLAAAAGLLQAWRGVQRNGAAVIALLTVAALTAAAFTLLSPSAQITRTGDFAEFGSTEAATLPGLDVAPGAGLLGTGIVLLLILALTAWQSIMELVSRR